MIIFAIDGNLKCLGTSYILKKVQDFGPKYILSKKKNSNKALICEPQF